MKPKPSKWKPQLLAAAFLILLWQVAAIAIDSPALPDPWRVLQRLCGPCAWTLLPHLAASLWRILAGLFFSCSLGIPVGLCMGRSERYDHWLGPLVFLLYPVPKVALLPISLILLGIGDGSKIALLSFILFFQITVTTRDAARSVPKAMMDSLRSLGGGQWDLLRHVIFPACLPRIITCLRISLGTAMAVLFLVETYATQLGAGYFIMDAFSRFDYLDVFSGVVAISLLGATLFWALELLEKRYCGWAQL